MISRARRILTDQLLLSVVRTDQAPVNLLTDANPLLHRQGVHPARYLSTSAITLDPPVHISLFSIAIFARTGIIQRIQPFALTVVAPLHEPLLVKCLEHLTVMTLKGGETDLVDDLVLK